MLIGWSLSKFSKSNVMRNLNLDQSLCVASLGRGKGCIRFWGRLTWHIGLRWAIVALWATCSLFLKDQARKIVWIQPGCFCLCWGLMSQSTIFQSCRDGATASWVINQYFRGVKCLAQGHNTAEVGFEPQTSRSGVRHSTTEPPRSPNQVVSLVLDILLQRKVQCRLGMPKH